MQRSTMKKIPTLFLQAAIVLAGIGVLIFMLWEPRIEGRNVNATLFDIYFKDLFLAYVYTASIAFFTALYQAFRMLGYVRQGKAFSEHVIGPLQMIQHCALIIVGFVVPAVAYLFIIRPGDDIAGGVFMGNLVIFISLIVAATANTLSGVLQEGRERA